MANYFNQSWIDKVKDSCDIVDVISRYIPLKQKGRTYWGNCPFHHENEPSFAVSPEKQFFNCFGCHVGGNVITFVSKYESLSFSETIKLLAKQNNIEIPETIDDEQVKRNAELKKKMLQINLACAKFYNKMLMSEKGKSARQYLYKRGLTDNILTRFGLGYSPDWTSIVEYLEKEGVSKEDAYKVGVLGCKDNRYYDFFAERIVFPIISSMGDVLGFSARITTQDYTKGKYKNSPDSICFNKSNIVYAINLLKKAGQKRNLDYAIICEGQMDVIALNQCGYDNVIACMGTALTPNHAREIKRYVEKVIVCFDGDGAGIKATLRSLDILSNAGLYVYVVSLPPGMDPDEYIKKYGKEKFDDLIYKAKHKNDYIFESIKNKYNLTDNLQKSNFIKEILEFINELKTSSDKEIYLKQVQNLTRISIETLKQDLKDGVVTATQKFEKNEPIRNTAYDDALNFVFSSYLHKKEYAKIEDFNVMNNTFFALLSSFLRENTQIDSTIFDILEQKFEKENIDSLKNYNFEAITHKEKYYKDCIKLIKLEELEFEYKILSEKISLLDNPTMRRESLQSLDEIFNKIQKIKMEE